MRSRWLDQIVWLEGKANGSQRWYYGLRLVAIVGGLIVPALIQTGGCNAPSLFF